MRISSLAVHSHQLHGINSETQTQTTRTMSEEENPKPLKKTSAVPLRKETVRVTLKATPSSDDHSDSAPPAPAPTIPLKGPETTAPAVPPPAATIPLTPPVTKAPSVKLQTASDAKNPVAAPTVAGSTFAGAENLVPPPKPPSLKIAKPDLGPETSKMDDTAVPEPAPTVGLATPATTQPAGASSQPLPQATVQMPAPQSPPVTVAVEGDGPQIATIGMADSEEAVASDGASTALSIASLVAALVVLGLQLGTASVWVNDPSHENPGWGRLFD